MECNNGTGVEIERQMHKLEHAFVLLGCHVDGFIVAFEKNIHAANAEIRLIRPNLAISAHRHGRPTYLPRKHGERDGIRQQLIQELYHGEHTQMIMSAVPATNPATPHQMMSPQMPFGSGNRR